MKVSAKVSAGQRAVDSDTKPACFVCVSAADGERVQPTFDLDPPIPRGATAWC